MLRDGMEKEHKILKAEQGHTHTRPPGAIPKGNGMTTATATSCFAQRVLLLNVFLFPLTLSPSLFAFNDVNDGTYRRQVVQVGFARFFGAVLLPILRA